MSSTFCTGKSQKKTSDASPQGADVKVLNLSKWFGGPNNRLKALENVTMEVPKGAFFSVVGQSGCGKTTLLRLIAGLETPSRGRIEVDGRQVEGTGWERGLIFQEPRLFPWATVEHNVRLGLPDRDSSVWPDLVAELLELVGLEGFAAAFPRKLSGGMAQRVALARALASTPRVLLLDEPLGALDAVTRARMQKELLGIWHKRKITMLAVTHDLDEAILLSTHIVVLSERPGTVKSVIPIQMEYPRDRTSMEFNRFKQELVKLLLEEVS